MTDPIESPEAFTSRLVCNSHDYDAALPLIRARDRAVRREALDTFRPLYDMGVEFSRLRKDIQSAPWRYDDMANSGENWLIADFGAWERWPDDTKRAESGKAILTTDRVRCSETWGDARGDAEFCAWARNTLEALIPTFKALHAALADSEET